MLKHLREKREARMLILEKLVAARNELILLGKGSKQLDSSIKLMRKKVAASNKKILKIIVDSEKQV